MLGRVTNYLRAEQTLSYLRRSTVRQAVLQESIASGYRVTRPSDAPADFVAAQQAETQFDRLNTYLNNVREGSNNLNESVSALQQVSALLNKATQITSQGINGTTDPTSYDALATEIDGVLDRMLQLGNSQVNGRYLYGGTATQDAPFTVATRDVNNRPATIVYQGSNERARTLIGPGEPTDTLYVGQQVFQRAGADTFATLIGIRDDLRNTTLTGPARADALTQRMAQLETIRTSILQTIGEQSASLETLEAVQSRVQDVQLSLQERSGNLRATDYADAIIRLNQETTIYQATLAVTAKIFDASLLSFLR